jgi:hypothetical protein
MRSLTRPSSRHASVSKTQRGLEACLSSTITAPLGGWNALDPLSEMPSTDAVIMQNFFPQTSQVELRGGSINWSTGLGSQVQTLMAYQGVSTNKLFGVTSGGKIYDCTTQGAVGAAVVTGLTNGQFQYVNFSTGSSTTYLLAVNGADGYYQYDGTSWTNPTLTGVTAANLINITATKTRLFFVEKNTMNAWFLPVNSLSGTVTQLNLGNVFTLGGYLQAIGTWSIDAGQGVSEYVLFISSVGQVAVYYGTDPSAAATWALVGVFRMGSSVGRRCLTKYAGDLLCITKDGLTPFSKTLMSSRVNTQIQLTNKIQRAMITSLQTSGGNFGWETTLFQPQNMLILNIPIGVGIQQQYVMNTITGAWANFTNWPANTFINFNDQLYFGENGVVRQCLNGAVSDIGANITGQCLQAFNGFEMPGKKKEFVAARPIISTTGSPGVSIEIRVDFDQSTPLLTPVSQPSVNYTFDNANFDQAYFGGSSAVQKGWQTVYGEGYYGAPFMQIVTNSVSAAWSSTTFAYKAGGSL